MVEALGNFVQSVCSNLQCKSIGKFQLSRWVVLAQVANMVLDMGFPQEKLDFRLKLGQSTIPTYQIGFGTWNMGLEIWIMLPSIRRTENRSIA